MAEGKTTKAAPKGQNGDAKQVESVTIADGWLHVHKRIQAGVLSSTGKSHVHVTTGGFSPIDGTDYSLNLVLISKPKGKGK